MPAHGEPGAAPHGSEGCLRDHRDAWPAGRGGLRPRPYSVSVFGVALAGSVPALGHAPVFSPLPAPCACATSFTGGLHEQSARERAGSRRGSPRRSSGPDLARARGGPHVRERRGAGGAPHRSIIILRTQILSSDSFVSISSNHFAPRLSAPGFEASTQYPDRVTGTHKYRRPIEPYPENLDGHKRGSAGAS